VLAVSMGIVALSLPGAAAQSSQPDPEPDAGSDEGYDAQLWLREQSVVVTPGATIQLVLQLDGTVPPDAMFTLSVGRRIEAPPEEIDRLLAAGELTTGTLTFSDYRLDELTRDEAGRFILTQQIAPAEGPRPEESTRLSGPGIYPVFVDVRDADDEPLASILTAVYRPPDGDAATIQSTVSLVLPVDAPPALQADGSVVVDADARQQLDSVAATLSGAPTLPATVALPPELIGQLAASAEAEDGALLDRLDAAVTGRHLLATPFVTLDPANAAASGLEEEYTDQLRLGEEALLDSLTSAGPDRSASVLSRASPSGLSLLRDLGVRAVVLPPAAVAAADGELVPTGHVLRTASEDAFVNVALAEQRFLTGWTQGADRVLAAYHVVIGLLASHFDGLVLGDVTRGAVLVPPAEWAPDTVFLGTIANLLANTPPLRPVTLTEWFQQVTSPRAGEDVVPVDAPTEDLTALRDRLLFERAAVNAYTSMAVTRPDLAPALEDLLRRTPAGELDDAARDPYFGAVDAELQSLASAVLPVEEDSFTITSRSARLPITVRTTSDEPLEVKIRLRSTKLLFPEGDVTVVVEDGSTQVDVPVEARSNGTFQVEVQLLTPFGDAPLATPTQLTVRSAGLSGLGIAVTITAVGVLLVWWVHHLRRNRAARRAAEDEARARHPAMSTDDDLVSESEGEPSQPEPSQPEHQ
jgi:hypothetical protein